MACACEMRPASRSLARPWLFSIASLQPPTPAASCVAPSPSLTPRSSESGVSRRPRGAEMH